jgi:hypothetical protein
MKMSLKYAKVALSVVTLPKLLSWKLFANVNALFANESEVVILGRHLARQRDTGNGAWPSRSGSFQAKPSAGGSGGPSLATRPGMDALIAGQVGKRQLQRSRSDAWTPELVSGPEKAEPTTVRRVKTRLAVGSERSC